MHTGGRIMKNKSSSALTRKLALTGILVAVVVILQIFSGYIHFGPFSITLALIPIIVGGALCGPVAGAFLGLCFSVVVLLNDSSAFLAVNPFGTVVTVILKGTLAGLASALIYQLLKPFKVHFVIEAKGKEKWRSDFGVAAAAIASPVVNTGLFLLGCKIFFMPTITEWAHAAGYESAGKFLILGIVGANFLVELAFVVVFSPIIARLIEIASKMHTSPSGK